MKRWIIILTVTAVAQYPSGLFASLLVSSVANSEILHYDSTGAFLGVFGISPVPSEAPTDLAFGSDGNLYAATSGNAVQRYDGSSGAFIDFFVDSSTSPLSSAGGIVFDSIGNLYVSSVGNSEILHYNIAGTFLGVFAVAPSVSEAPIDLAFGPDGNLYAASAGNSVQRYNGTTGAFIDNFVDSATSPLSTPGGVVFGPGGVLYVSSVANSEILHYDSTGAFLGVFAVGPSASEAPNEMVFGPDGNLYAASEGNSVQRYNGTTGAFIDNFVDSATSPLSTPGGLVFAPGHPPDPIPEPSTFTLALMGLLMLSCHGRRRRRR